MSVPAAPLLVPLTRRAQSSQHSAKAVIFWKLSPAVDAGNHVTSGKD